MNEKLYIKNYELRGLINDQLAEKLGSSFQLYIADGEYYSPSLNDAERIIKQSKIDRYDWIRERFDCDDFALVLKSEFALDAYRQTKRRAPYCFGIVWGMLPGAHAINWMVNDDRKLRFIEPQTDGIFFPRANDKDIWFMMA